MKDANKSLEIAPQRLFIIGNGFDLMHGLKTAYSNFRTYIIEYGLSSKVPSVSKSSEFLIAFFDKYCNGTNWGNIELNLYEITSEVENRAADIVKNFDNFLDELFILELSISDYLYNLSALFYEWVNKINVEYVCINSDFQILTQNKPSAFLSFNYTPVLEKFYNIRNICHIHGQQNETIIMGHSFDKSYSLEYFLLEYVEPTLFDQFFRLKKDCREQIEKNKEFFNQTNYWKEIYSHGFSFSPVDLPYIEEICKKTDKLSIWYLSDYEDSNTREYFKRIIKKCGFIGTFELFHI